VWDDPKNTYSNIIDVYASRVRRKVDDGESAPMVTTLRGTGFMLQPANVAGPSTAASPAATRSTKTVARRRGARRGD